jgi:hypothetical protein
MVSEDACLLEYNTVLLGEWFQTFLRSIVPWTTVPLTMKALCSLGTSRATCPTIVQYPGRPESLSVSIFHTVDYPNFHTLSLDVFARQFVLNRTNFRRVCKITKSDYMLHCVHSCVLPST